MKGSTHNSTKRNPIQHSDNTPRKSIYDGVKITKCGIDIAIAVISVLLFASLVVAILHS